VLDLNGLDPVRDAHRLSPEKLTWANLGRKSFARPWAACKGVQKGETRERNLPVDPQLQALLDAMQTAGFPKIGTLTAAQLRAMPRPPLVIATQMASVEDKSIPGPHGDIPVRTYRPAGETRGLIVYFHGGGWVLGDLDSVDPAVRAIAAASGCAAVSVDYRLAPEHAFPAAVDDALAALGWAARERGALTGLADAPLILMGDSAGGNLAAVCAQHARDAGGPSIALQVLIYPTVEGEHVVTADPAFEPPFLDRGEMAWFIDQYVPAELRRDPRFAPSLAANLAGLPPAFIVTAEHDILTAEGLRYGEKLRAAGVDVTSLKYPGAIHGFVTMGWAFDIGRKAIGDISEEIERRLGRAEA
jgi:acetyl esterase